MSGKNDVRIDVVGDVGGFASATAQAEKELDGLKNKAAQAGGGLGALEQAAQGARDTISGHLNQAIAEWSGSMGFATVETMSLVEKTIMATGVFGAAAVAVGGLALAYKAGHDESKAFADTLIMSGNVVGKTTGDLNDMALSVANTTKATRGHVAEAMKDAVAFGNVGSASLEKVVEAAVRMERETGTAVDKTVKQFSELGKEPVTASLKLNDQYNYLTASVYRQIKALEDQGRTVEAATLAQNTFADSINSRTGEIEGNLGSIERGWRAVKDAVMGAVSAAANIGRLKGPEEELAGLKKQLATGGYDFSLTEGDIKQQISAVELYIDKQKKVGQEKERQAALEKAGIEWAREGDKWLSKKEQKLRELTKLAVTASAANAPPQEIDARIKAIEEKYAEKAPRGRSGGGSKVDQGGKLIERLDEQIALKNADAASTEKQSAAEQQRTRVIFEMDAGTLKVTKSQRALIEGRLDDIVSLEAQIKAQREFTAGVERLEAANVKARQSMLEQIATAERETELYGLTAAQISVVEQARLEDAIALATERGATEAQLTTLREELALRGQLSEALSKKEAKVYDLADAKKAVDGEGKEMGEFAKQAAKNMQDAMADFFIDPTKKGIQSIVETFAQTVQKMIAQAAAAQLGKLLFGDMDKTGNLGGWMGKLFGSFGGGGGGGGAVSSGTPFSSADLAWLEAPMLHSGGLVTAGGWASSRMVPAGAFANAPRFHGGGLAGDEVPAILQKGERVLTKEQQKSGRDSGGQRPIVVNVNSSTGDPAEIRRSAAAGARTALGFMSGSRRYA